MTFTVKLEVELDDELFEKASVNDIIEWVYFNTGYQASIKLTNPLCEYEMTAIECNIPEKYRLKKS